MTRRLFLQGAGGLLLGVPSLMSMIPKAEAQQAASAAMRFVVMNNWYGRDYRKWYSHDDKAVTRVTTNGGYSHRTLSDLPGDISPILPASMWDTNLRRKMILVRGLDVVDLHDGHNTTVALSGTLEGGADRDYHKFPYSMDALVESSSLFYPTTPTVRALRVAPDGPAWDQSWSIFQFSWSSASGRLADLTTLTWPHTVYQRYFSKVVLDAATQRARRLQVVTNSVFQDYSSTMSSRKISAEDKLKLDHVMQLLSQAEKKLGVQATAPGGVCAAPASASTLPTDFRQYTSTDLVYGATRDLMTVALACGMTKICIMGHTMMGDDFVRDRTALIKHHDSAHNPNGGVSNDGAYPPALVMNRYNYDHAARFVKQLDSVIDVDGNTLLDNTIVYINNDDSTGAHELYDMPVILAGGKNVLRTDMMIDYRNTVGQRGDATSINTMPLGRPYNNLFVTLFKSLGLGPETYKVTPDQLGFGYMTRNAQYLPTTKAYKFRNYYAPFLTDAAKDEVLPHILLKG